MANPNLRKHLRNPSTGAGIADQAITAKLLDGGATITSDTTDSNGLADLNIGYPGPHAVEVTYQGKTLRQSSREVGHIGTFSGADLPTAFRALTDGVIDGYLNELAVSAGSGLQVSIATGGAMALGHVYENSSASTVAVTTPDGTNPRIDLVVLRFIPKGQTAEGKFELAVVAGTAQAVPVAPTPTQTSSVWEIELAQLAVAAGASGFTGGNFTDRRTYVGPKVAGTAIQALLDAKQPLDAELTALAGISSNGVLARTGSGTAAARTITAADAKIVATNGNGVSGNPTVGLGTVAQSDITGLVAALAAKAPSSSPTLSNATLTGTVTVPDAALAIADTNGLQTALDGKAATSHTHTSANVTDFAETVRDTMGTALVAGSNVTITPNDGADTITIAASGGGSSGITVQEGDSTVASGVTTLDFDASDFNVTETPSGEANVALAYGTSAGTPAEGNHTHTGTYAPTGHTHDMAAMRTGSVSKSYSATSITTDQEVATFDLTLSVGTKYNIVAFGTFEGFATVGQTAEIQLGIKIGSAATDWGSQSSSEDESSPISASSFAGDFTAESSTLTISVRARRQTGSGSCFVRSGHAFAYAFQANTLGEE